jgi:hypothetical protein
VPAACTGYTDGFSYSGDATYVFGADGTLSLEGSATMTWDLRMTDACAVELGADDAAAYCGSMQAPEAEPEAEVDCTTSTNLCDCHVVQGPFEFNLPPAAYQTSGSDLILGDDTVSYCVDGDTLRLAMNGATTTYLVRE